jgi:hypothetical protein
MGKAKRKQDGKEVSETSDKTARAHDGGGENR